jgi:transposase
MSWKDVSSREERIRFAVLADKGRRTMTELCAEFRISRKTGDKWLRRHPWLGLAGTREQSRRPWQTALGDAADRRAESVSLCPGGPPDF